MKLKFKIVIAFTTIAATVAVFNSNTARSFSSGAPAGYCNSPANPGATCHACHSSGPAPATIPGMITSNIPVSGYAPGTTYTITATVSRQGHTRFGFEISPQDLNGNLVGSMGDLGTETTFQQSGMYITHSSNSLLSNDTKTWQFEWTAPASGSGSVTFYGAFNITNNDGSYTGDTIVLSTSTFPEDINLFTAETNNTPGAPSAFADHNSLYLHNVPAQTSTISLVDDAGKTCWQSEEIYADAFQEYGQFALPSDLPAGIYIVRMQSPSYSWCSRILIVN